MRNTSHCCIVLSLYPNTLSWCLYRPNRSLSGKEALVLDPRDQLSARLSFGCPLCGDSSRDILETKGLQTSESDYESRFNAK